jgi:hypothetical protein
MLACSIAFCPCVGLQFVLQPHNPRTCCPDSTIYPTQAFVPDPASGTVPKTSKIQADLGETSKLLSHGADNVRQRVEMVITDIAKTRAKLDLLLAVLDTGEDLEV